MRLFLSKNSINKFSFYCKAPYEADIGYPHQKKKKKIKCIKSDDFSVSAWNILFHIHWAYSSFPSSS